MFYFYTVKHIVSTLEENKNINKVHRQFITQPFNFIYHIKLSTHHRVLVLCFWVILVITIYCLSMETFAKKYLKIVHPRVSKNVKCSRSFQKNNVWKILFCNFFIRSHWITVVLSISTESIFSDLFDNLFKSSRKFSEHMKKCLYFY